MSFSPLINNIASSTIRSLNFVRQSLAKCNESVKSAAYLGLVRPKLECTSSVWDPHLSKDIQSIAMNPENCSQMGKIQWKGRPVCSQSYSGQYYTLEDAC